MTVRPSTYNKVCTTSRTMRRMALARQMAHVRVTHTTTKCQLKLTATAASSIASAPSVIFCKHKTSMMHSICTTGH